MNRIILAWKRQPMLCSYRGPGLGSTNVPFACSCQIRNAHTSERGPAFTQKDDAFIIQHKHQKTPEREIARLLGRPSVLAIRNRVRKLRQAGELSPKGRPDPVLWTAEEDATLLAMIFASVPYTEIASRLGRTKVACQNRERHLEVKASPSKDSHDVDFSQDEGEQRKAQHAPDQDPPHSNVPTNSS
ncbi:helix-turn-helix domain containing [Lecanosticta acicola]|uniref:Helix-turn-helix domain containing n=1 Tax=Lecanosticta acicola TaxID=111012 RepID=A0AAI8W1V4_9PEZI|nr:helix-turn-helix domain containing [Lecanosticta acicola]